MNFLINFFLIIFFISKSASSNEDYPEKIIFKINNKAYITSDLEKRNKYYKLLFEEKNYNHQNIIQDYISLILFNEYFKKNKKKKNFNIEENYKEIFEKYENQQNTELSLIFNDFLLLFFAVY